MSWCQQCGVANRPEVAIGVDEDGDPACAMHAVKGNKEKLMNLEDAPKCLASDCEARTKSKVGYCAKHFFLSYSKNKGAAPTCSVCGETLRRDNATGLCKQHRGNTHPQKAATPKKAVVKKAAASNIRRGDELIDRFLERPSVGHVDLVKIKADLMAKLAAIELIEAMIRGA
jgi:hypothetical protein